MAVDARKTDAIDRIVDVASIVLISLAAVLSAICGYQAGTWGSHATMLYNRADVYRLAAAQATERANALTIIDVAAFLRYISAYDAHDATMEAYLQRTFRPEMERAVRAWAATKPRSNPHAPSSPFVMPEYRLATTQEAADKSRLAAADFQSAQDANRTSDAFLLLTVIFAGVSFLAGVSTKLVYPRHVVVVGLGSAFLVYGLVRMAGMQFL